MQTLRTLPLGVLACLLATSLGCKKEQGDSAPTKEDKASPKTTDDKVKTPAAENKPAAGRPAPTTTAQAVPPSGPTVTLIEAGADPKRALRIAPKKGDKQTASMTMKMDLELDMNGTAMPKQGMPVTEMVMAVKVTDVSPEGDIRWEFEYTDIDAKGGPGVQPAVLSATKAAIAGLKGFKGHAVVTNRGFLKEGDFEIPDKMDQQMKQMLDGMRQSLAQLTAPLPEEPVGVGAKWKVDQVISQNGLTIKQAVNYELVKLTEQLAVANIKLTQTADPQKIVNDQMPPGVDARLESLTSVGTGETRFHMAKVVPQKGTVNAKMKMTTAIKAGGQSQTVKMKMGMTMDIKSD